jgi:hypothetical protein
MMMQGNGLLLTLLSGFAVGAAITISGGGAAQAQEPQEHQSVFERARPDYDPLGLHAGSFRIFPRAEVGEAYNDNIFATKNNEDGDFITLLRPQIRAESDWGRHAVALQAGAEGGRYFDHTGENYLDGYVNADGRIDIVHDTFIRTGLGWQHLHEDRGSPDDVAGEEPTEYELYSANLGISRARGIISASLDGRVDRWSWHNVNAPGGHIEQTQRDRNQYLLVGQVGYEYLPNTSAFIRVSGRLRRYDGEDDTSSPPVDRDSEGVAAVVGTQLNFTGKTSGEVFLGYQHTKYDDSSLDSYSSPSGGLDLLWNVTGLTSIRAFGTGAVEETTQNGASSYLAVRFGASIEHELLRNLLVGGAFTVGRDHYEGISRDDDLYIAGLTARYLINRNFYAGAELTHRTRTSDGSGDEFSQNVILLRIGAQL